MISVLDIYKIGVGPSSSHTVGPMKIARHFIEAVRAAGFSPAACTAELHGSLALTGRGHKTDEAVMLGLAGFEPETVDIDSIPSFISKVRSEKKLPTPAGVVDFDAERDMMFIPECPPLHENGMKITAHDDNGGEFSGVYYSVGGGFFKTVF